MNNSCFYTTVRLLCYFTANGEITGQFEFTVTIHDADDQILDFTLLLHCETLKASSLFYVENKYI